MRNRRKITTFLWFDGQAEEAAQHYVSIFRDGRILEVDRYTDAGPGPKGAAMIVRFELAGQEFLALNGGPQFKFNEAISLAAACDTRAELDELRARLGAGGEEGQCGWLNDRFGLSWQIVPSAVPELLRDPGPEKATRVMRALFRMKKIDIGLLRRAHAGA